MGTTKHDRDDIRHDEIGLLEREKARGQVDGIGVPHAAKDGAEERLHGPEDVAGDALQVDAGVLSNLVSHELAHMLYPGWSDLRPDQRDEMEAFAKILAPTLRARLPSQVHEAQPMIDLAMDCVRSADAS